jgi:cyclophilin family peptidyl-prolyl cis-trans isomerase
MKSRIVCSLASLLLISTFAAAADDPQPAGKRGPKAAEFYRLHAEMNTLLGEFAALQTKYRTAGEDKKAEIQQQWKVLVAKGEKLEPKLVEAAEDAYAEAPNADKEITKLLVALLGKNVQNDNYEPAAKIGKLLMDNKTTDGRVANLAGIAAFCTNDFDAAERYLGQAEKDGYYQSPSKDDKLQQYGAMDLQNIGYYKEAWAKEKAIRQSEAKADDLPQVRLKTNKGDIVIELFENQAPNSVANFISLVNKGFYNGLTFHRVIAGFMAQGGDPTGTGSGGPGYSIPCECYKDGHRLHFRGTLSMAHAGRDTGGSQFFLTFVPTQHLDGRHTAFGRVVEGMDVLAKIQRRDPGDAEAPRPDKIIKAEVVRKRPHEYKPQKMPE